MLVLLTAYAAPRVNDPRRSGEPSAEPGQGADVVGRHRGLVRRTALISALTMASRLLGYVRESLAAAIFGDRSAINDAFVTAWRVPNLFRSLMGEGAIATSLQTALTRADAQGGEEAGRTLFLAIARAVAWFAGAFCVAGIAVVVLLPDTMPLTGWRWLGADPGPVRDLTARMLPFVLFACLSAVAAGGLHVRGHFLAPSLGPVVMNLAWVGALVWVAGRYGALFTSGLADFEQQRGMAGELALLVLAAGAALLLVHVPALRSRGLLVPRPGVTPGPAVAGREVWSILRASAPLALGAAVYQVNILVDGFLAESLLPDGGPTALYYATRLQQLPLSLVSIAATSAVFPALTALGHTRDLDGLRRLHDRTHRAVAFLAIPATVGLLVFAEPIVSLCFEHGAFGEHGVERTAAGLRGLTLAILPAGAAGLVARTRYAVGDFAGPVRVAIGMLILNTALNFLFVGGLGMDVGGLALATGITAWGNLLLLLPGLRRLGLPPAEAGLRRGFLVMALAAAVGCGSAWVLTGWTIDPQRAGLTLAVGIPVAMALYAGVSIALGLPEIGRALALLRTPRA